MDLETIRTAIDTGLGAIALLYAHRIGALLKTLTERIAKLEAKVSKPRPRSKPRKKVV
jgi:hypothetical protein